MLDAFRSVTNERGSGADIYLSNNPCDPYQSDGTTPTDYSGTLNTNRDVWLTTASSGAGYEVHYDAGRRTYSSYDEGAAAVGDPSKVVINEYLMAPKDSGPNEWIELYNPTPASVDLGGLYVDDLAGGGGSPKQIPDGTVIAAGSHYVMEFPSGFLNNTGSDEVRYLQMSGGTETVYDSTSYSLSSVQYDKVFHRVGDAGPWCTKISVDVTKGAANVETCP